MNALEEVKDKLEKLNDVLGKARAEFLRYHALKDHVLAVLIKEAEGSSHAEKKNNAYATKEWEEFAEKLSRSEAVYEFQKLKFSILEKEFQSLYLEAKLNEQIIKKP